MPSAVASASAPMMEVERIAVTVAGIASASALAISPGMLRAICIEPAKVSAVAVATSPEIEVVAPVVITPARASAIAVATSPLTLRAI